MIVEEFILGAKIVTYNPFRVVDVFVLVTHWVAKACKAASVLEAAALLRLRLVFGQVFSGRA
jgi:hypothetical protein